jgi:hypothetical protein
MKKSDLQFGCQASGNQPTVAGLMSGEMGAMPRTFV